MKIKIANLSSTRRALVAKWLDTASDEMFEAPGKDKGFTPDETKIIHLTIRDIIANFKGQS